MLSLGLFTFTICRRCKSLTSLGIKHQLLFLWKFPTLNLRIFSLSPIQIIRRFWWCSQISSVSYLFMIMFYSFYIVTEIFSCKYDADVQLTKVYYKNAKQGDIISAYYSVCILFSVRFPIFYTSTAWREIYLLCLLHQNWNTMLWFDRCWRNRRYQA